MGISVSFLLFMHVYAKRYNPIIRITRHCSCSLELNEPEAVLLLRRDGVLQRPPSVVLFLHHGQRFLLLRGRRALPPGRDAPVLAPESRGQGQLEALFQGGPRQTEVQYANLSHSLS